MAYQINFPNWRLEWESPSHILRIIKVLEPPYQYWVLQKVHDMTHEWWEPYFCSCLFEDAWCVARRCEPKYEFRFRGKEYA